MSITRVVAITGCDSGLGWAIAARCAREGLLTIPGMYQGTDTEAAEALRKLRAFPCALDVTSDESVAKFRGYVNGILEENPDYELHAVVNNAGVMTIGNFEWQTPAMIHSTVNINLLGAMRVAAAFLPDLRRSASKHRSCSKPRLINVASHCGLQPLPGFAAYSATKAGMLAWTKALRFEHRDQGVAALAFVPGGFVSSSNIIAQQTSHGKSMLENLTPEQKAFYEKQIVALTNYLGSTAREARYDSLKDENIIETFMKALTEDDPRELYKVQSWRYMFYYNLMKMPFPDFVQHWFMRKFLSFPAIE